MGLQKARVDTKMSILITLLIAQSVIALQSKHSVPLHHHYHIKGMSH